MYLSFNGCVSSSLESYVDNKYYKEVTEEELLNPTIIASYLLDIAKDINFKLTIDWAIDYANNLKYKDKHIAKTIIAKQSMKRFINKGKKDDGQLSLF